MRTLAVYSIKGGVGKTATAVNLAYLAAMQGARVLLWDLDPQGAATFYFRIESKIKGGARKLIRGKMDIADQIKGTDFEGLDLLPADFSYRNLDLALDEIKKPRKRLARLLAPFADEYDYLFLDCAPSISIVSESVFSAAEALLVPVVPTPLSLRTLQQLHDHLKREGLSHLSLQPFYCMVDRRKKMHREIFEQHEQAGVAFLDSSIPYSTWIERMGIERAPVSTFAWRTSAARAYRDLWKEVSS